MKKFLIAAILAASNITATRAESPVTDPGAVPGAMSGRNIAMWQSHGRYYDASEDRWKWQRCRLFGTVEDLYTRSYVVPFLVPMLENAGAYVMLPRERDSHSTEIIIDNDGALAVDGYRESHHKHKWHQTKESGFAHKHMTLADRMNPFGEGTARSVKTVRSKDAHKASTASWSAPVAESGNYAVYVSYPALKDAVRKVRYTIHTAVGDRQVYVNQTMGAGTWVYVGTFPFESSKSAQKLVSLTNISDSDGEIGADAVRIGGGMGNVTRGPESAVSGMPRWAEASRYWLQWAGIPDSVYANQESDYRDDIFCRPQWVNYLRDELNIPVDLVMAFHSDAGTLGGDSIVGTLGIYYTQKKRGKFSDGRPRTLSGKLCDAIVTSVVNDIRTGYDPAWTRRKMRDASYIEARVPEVPTMLLELLSHQNLADMRYGLDPQFKFDVSRAVYKGILKYLSGQGLAQYIVQPLPPVHTELKQIKDKRFRLSWKEQRDSLEPTARPVDYIVEVREGYDCNAPFRQLEITSDTGMDVEVPAGEIRSYRIIARNAGGKSFPSEVMTAGHAPASKGTVRVVNGFTRVSAPDDFEAEGFAGFGLKDAGVPMVSDLSFTGKQYNFDRNEPWVHDDNPGFGASFADMETRPVYGNSSDNILSHGVAIMQAGFSFDSSSAAAFAEGNDMPDAVNLILGLQKQTKIGKGHRPASHATFPQALRERIYDLTRSGIPIMASGAYLASDSKNDSDSQLFLQNIFGLKLRSAMATNSGKTTFVRSQFSNLFNGAAPEFTTAIGARPYVVGAPDAIVGDALGSATIMRYSDNQSPAAVAYKTASHRAVAFGFPLEAIKTQAQLNKLIRQTLQFIIPE